MKTKLHVELSHAKNPDIRSGGYWSEPKESGRKRLVAVDSVEHAAKVCREYITHNDLGGGNWTGGKVWDSCGKRVLVAKISYNGRAWDISGKEIRIGDDETAEELMARIQKMPRTNGLIAV